MEDQVLYLPIQINGGNELPKVLKERELFIKINSDGNPDPHLYVGVASRNVNQIVPLVAEYSDKLEDKYSRFNFNTTVNDGASFVGGFTIMSNGLNGKDNKSGIISDVKLRKTKELVVDTDSESVIFGTENDMNKIKNPRKGQVFFQI